MVIIKVFNNNAVIARDAENREIVLMGCGIAFKKKNGDEVDKQLLFLALKNLNDREKEIVRLRFGLNGKREKTQKEVADMLGISQSYISRLEKKIISRLKKEINKMI